MIFKVHKFQKKRIGFILFATFLPVCMHLLQTTNSKINMQETVSTMAVPVTSKTIIIDAGHGGEDGGAVSKNRSI